MPDLNAPPVSAPDIFRVQIPFAVPFVFSGAAALVIEGRISGLSLLGLVPIDADIPPDTVGSGVPGPGPGCTVASPTGPVEMTMTSTLTNRGPLFSIGWQGSSVAPPGSPVGMLVGTGVPIGNPLPSPPCTPVYSNGDLALLTLPSANAGGATSFAVPLPYNPQFAGAPVYLQTFAFDCGHPMCLAFSRGVRVAFPPNPRFVPVQHLYAPSSTATTGTLVYNGGLVLEFYR
jgi:hypothetical protein